MAQLGRPGRADRIFGLLGCTHRLSDELWEFQRLQRQNVLDSGLAHAQPSVLSPALPGRNAVCAAGACAAYNFYGSRLRHEGTCGAGALFAALQRGFSPGASFWTQTGYSNPGAPFSSYYYSLV